MEILDILLQASFWAAVLRIASPLIFATMGELLCERAGVLNLGIEGIMTVGAFTGWITVWAGAPLWGGVAAAFAAGVFCGALLGVLTVPFGLSQHVVGLGLTLLATSASYFAYRVALPQVSTPPVIAPFAPTGWPVLGAQTVLTWGALGLVPFIGWFLWRTPLGLALRAVGENPAAVEAQGLPVHALRMGAVMAGSGLMAVGGSFLTLSAFNSFFFEMINGRGWICIALVVFGAWMPGRALLGALLFAGFDALQIRLQQTGLGAHLPYQLFLALPYLLSIFALIAMSRRAEVPGALMVPYNRGER